MTVSHTCFDSMRTKPTPRLMPLGARRIRVDTTLPKLLNIASRSFSEVCSGRLAMYRFESSRSCCCNRQQQETKQKETSPPQDMTAIHTRVSTEYLPTWSILTAGGRVIGPEISASRWHSCVWAILHCWRPIGTESDVETPPLVHIAMVLTRRQNIWCYTARHTTRRGGSHGQISTIKATQDDPPRRPGMREKKRLNKNNNKRL